MQTSLLGPGTVSVDQLAAMFQPDVLPPPVQRTEHGGAAPAEVVAAAAEVGVWKRANCANPASSATLAHRRPDNGLRLTHALPLFST
jgi:hypothetical protein